MTAAELRDALRLLGLSHRGAAQQLGVAKTSIHRWLTGRRPIPGPVAAAIRCWLRKYQETP